MPKNFAIVGAGRVGHGLGRRLHELGCRIDVVFARTKTNARKTSASKAALLTVPDGAAARTAEEMARIGGGESRGKLVLHTSGALHSTVFAPSKLCGAAVGSMHPPQSFSGVGTPRLKGRVFETAGDALAVRMARSIVRALGETPVNVTAAEKARYHAAGAFGAGHILAREEAGVQLLADAGMNRSTARKALFSLLRRVPQNYEMLGPHHTWTGPLRAAITEWWSRTGRRLLERRPEFWKPIRQ